VKTKDKQSFLIFAIRSHPPQIQAQKYTSCISNSPKLCTSRYGNHFGSPKALAASLVCEAWIVCPRCRMYGMLQYPLGEMGCDSTTSASSPFEFSPSGASARTTDTCTVIRRGWRFAGMP
jgi:hypothetical protein